MTDYQTLMSASMQRAIKVAVDMPADRLRKALNDGLSQAARRYQAQTSTRLFAAATRRQR